MPAQIRPTTVGCSCEDPSDSTLGRRCAFLRSTRLIQLVFGLFVISVCDVGSSHANMVRLPPFEIRGPLDLAVMALMFCATTIVEFFVVYWILGSPKKARRGLFLFALLVNLITNPPAQLWVWILGEWFVIELVVIIVECGLMAWVFRRMHHSGKLDHPVTGVRTAATVLTANVVSFILGVVSSGIMTVISSARPPALPFWRLIF